MPSEYAQVMRLCEFSPVQMSQFLARYQIEMRLCASDTLIPGSYWGDDEAGLIGHRLYARENTPIHSILHEAGHYICVDPARRACLERDAGSDNAEESAVCYLQVLLADEIPEVGRERMFDDMDAWGYSFRLGSTRAWFEHDASDALDWLIQHKLVQNQRPNFQLRQTF